MHARVVGLIVVAALSGMSAPGCTFLTNFDQFHPEDDGGGGLDGGVRDAAPEDAEPEDAEPEDAPSTDGARDGAMPDAQTDGGASVDITVELGGDGEGTVSSSGGEISCAPTCTARFPIGTELVLTAVASTGSSFDGWDGTECDSIDGDACTLTVTAAATLTPSFTLARHTVSVSRSGDGSGTVQSSDGAIHCDGTTDEVCSVQVAHGTTVMLTATATGGSSFSGWGGACSGTGACSIVVEDDQSVSATFDRDRVSLTVSVTGDGRVSSSPTGIDCGIDCSESFVALDATVVTLTATPSLGNSFVSWTGACTGTTPTCMVTMSASRSVRAIFQTNDYTLTVVPGGTGSGTVSSVDPPDAIDCGATCETTQPFGTSIVLTASAATGSSFAGWSGGGCSGTAACVVSLSDDTTITANFTLNRYSLGVSLAGAGMGTVTSSPTGVTCGADCTEQYDHGTVVTLTATPMAGSTFTGWSGGCTGTGSCMVTMTTMRSVTATFAQNSYMLSVARSGDGTGTVTSGDGMINCGGACAGTYAHGTTVTLSAVAASGSFFAGWGGACSGTGSCVVSMTAAASVTASFTRSSSIVSVTKSGQGTVLSTSPDGRINCGASCSASFTSGDTVTLTATAEAGHTFTGWSGACTGTGTCTIMVGGSAVAVTATFTPLPRTLTVMRAGMGGGFIDSSPSGITCPTDCTETYTNGTMVTLFPSADPTSVFIGWSGACAAAGTAPCTLTLTSDVSITGTFAPRTYTVSASVTGAGNGSISAAGISCSTTGGDCTESVTAGTTMMFTASAGSGSAFAGWGGACATSVGPTCTVTISADTSVSANFSQALWMLSVSKSGGVTPSTGGVVAALDGSLTCGASCSSTAATYPNGTVVTLRATPDSGYRFNGWTGACSGTGDCTVNMTAARSVTARFVRQYAVSVTLSDDAGGLTSLIRSGDGSIGCTASGTGCNAFFDSGAVVQLTAHPPPWATFAGWGGACSGRGDCSLTVTADASVRAGFTRIANLAFVTAQTFQGALGGVSGADGECARAASAAYLPGTFIAYIGDATISTVDRLGSSDGAWVRLDGRALADSTETLTRGLAQHPLFITEMGSPPPMGAQAVWTGSGAASTCLGWTSSSSTVQGAFGEATRVLDGFALHGVQGCDRPARLYCIQTGGGPMAPVLAPPVGSSAGYAFAISGAGATGSITRASMDSMCASQAMARAYPGTYIALVGLATAAASSRVMFTGPWFRPDGWRVGDPNALMRGDVVLEAPLVITSDGNFTESTTAWTGYGSGGPDTAAGAGTGTCSDWSVSTSAATAFAGNMGSIEPSWWGRSGGTALSCSARRGWYCVRAN